MKNLTLLFAISIACSTFAQVPNYVATTGLIGWWPFNGNANDESGNGNNGTVSGASLTTDKNGIANQAYSFDGVNDFIDAGSSISFSNFTISTWVYINSYSSALNALVSKISTNFQNFELGINSNTSTPANVPSMSWGTGSAWQSINSIQAFPVTNWHHLVVSFNSSNVMTLYFDGNVVSTSSTTNYANVANFKTYFGARPNTQGISTTTFFHNGKLDDIGIWNRALTQQEITNLYNGVYNLPVELTQFSATCSENATNINWQTATEHNSAYFEVLKSRDGENWNSLATVDAAGNSFEAINYSINDNTDATTVYYKLNQVDKDGKSQVYGPISANCNENTSLFISPNPTNGEFNIVGMEYFESITSLELKDATGKVVKAMQPTTTQFTCTELKAGVYFLAVLSNKTEQIIKIIKE
jgi:hypothetical protein